MRIVEFRITRFQFARDRVIGDSQVRADDVNIAALELIADTGAVGLGFIQTLFYPAARSGRDRAGVSSPKSGPASKASRRRRWCIGSAGRAAATSGPTTLPFHEALQVALWDLAAKEVDLPLHQLLGSRRDKVEAYASGLDFHLSDDDFAKFFAHADSIGYRAFKIKVGHPDFDWDLNRLKLLQGSGPQGRAGDDRLPTKPGAPRKRWSSSTAIRRRRARPAVGGGPDPPQRLSTACKMLRGAATGR